MYLGRIVERAPTEAIFAAPNHPYTQALLAERPRHRTSGKRRFSADQGRDPLAARSRRRAAISTRAARTPSTRCRIERPALKEIAPGRRSACHLNDGA